MKLGSTEIMETFAEGFGMRYTRLVITAHDEYWLDAALRAVTGYGTSVLGCDLEIAVEGHLAAEQTPDGRPGAAVMGFGFSSEAVGKAITNRVGQCLMTAASTAVYDGLANAEKRLDLGNFVRFFGDGFQKSKVIGSQRYWRIPVMEGEFVVEDTCGVENGVAGGNIIVQGEDGVQTYAAVRRAIEAIAEMPEVITPFPGGVARSGSKVGSQYQGLRASTAEAYCPTLRGRVESQLHPDANCALEIVIDGANQTVVGSAMKECVRAAAGKGVVAIGAGNYGGQLGPYHFHLHQLLQS
jgi:formylmethanofuran--tetrahydromethanopterin N-formyltransferase